MLFGMVFVVVIMVIVIILALCLHASYTYIFFIVLICYLWLGFQSIVFVTLAFLLRFSHVAIFKIASVSQVCTQRVS